MVSRSTGVDPPAPGGAGLPPHAYVPGHRPHPTRDPRGHAYGKPQDPPPAALDPDAWRESLPYLRGIELFEHGYYWEAHEAWEGLWIAAGREGPVAELLRGLILLAAAGVKIRQGRGAGAATLGSRAQRCFERARQQHGTERMAGLALAELLAFAEHVQAEGPRLPGSPEADVAVVFRRRLPLLEE
jgi:predicted metal-dependent hydrolase